MKRCSFAVMFLLGVVMANRTPAATLYVTPAGTDPAGASWAAPTSLTNALAIGKSNDAIWLAQGVYTNGATFTISSNGVALYGGFTNGMATFAERDWAAYPALLDGRSNAWRGVTVSGSGITLDGLVITNSAGGGLTKTAGGALTLANCRVVRNLGKNMTGVGCNFTSGSVLITNCVVAANEMPYNNGSYMGTKNGLGIYASGITLDIVDSVIRDQSSHMVDARGGYGGGLYFDNGTLRVLRTDFLDNRGPDNGGGGAAVYLGNNANMAATFSNCVFRGNVTWDYNQAYGGAVWANLNAARTAAFVNCTFAYNVNSNGNGGALYQSAGTVILKNVILWTNSAPKAGYTGREIYVAGGTLRASYACLSATVNPWLFVSSGSATLFNCMTNDPQFAGTADLHVRSPAGRWSGGSFVTSDTVFSPCLDAGDPADAVGAEPSVNGSRINVGAYGGTAQASKSPAAAPEVVNRGAAALDYTRMSLRGELVNASPVIADAGICYGTNSVAGDTTNGWQVARLLYPPQQTGTVFSVTTPYLLPNTVYYCRVYASNALGVSWSAISNFTTSASYPPLYGVGGGSNVIHVRAGAAGEGDGRDWHNAYTKIADAIAVMGGSRTNIWITGGTYSEGALLTLAMGANMIGGFAGTESAVADRALTNALGAVTNVTSINGEVIHRCLAVTGGNVWLDTLSFSNSTLPKALEKSGGGFLTLNNCRIEKNTMADGYTAGAGNGLGAYFGAGSVFMTNCVIADNRFSQASGDGKYSNKGIGIYGNNVNLDIADCVFSNQVGDPSTARTLRGAGLAFEGGTCRVARTQFIGNLGAANGGGGGAVYLGNGATLTAVFSNCVFRGNAVQTYSSAGYGGAVFLELNAARTASFVNCSFAANTNASTSGKGGAFYLASGGLELKNGILWTNRVTGTGSAGHELSRSGGSLNVRYSSLTGQSSPHVDGTVSFTECRSGDPLFAGLADPHLLSPAGRWDPGTKAFVATDSVYSACIDTGDPADPVAAEPSPNGARINMGAYGGTAQASKSPPPIPPRLADRGSLVNGHRAAVSGELTNDTLVSASVYLCYGDEPVVGDTTNGWDAVVSLGGKQNGSVFSVWTPALLPATTYYFRWYAENGDGSDWTPAGSFLTGAIPPGGGPDIIHVNRLATGAADGTDWAHAFTRIADGLTAISGARSNIWITGGTYGEGARLILGIGANLIGGFAGTEGAIAQRALTNAQGVVTNYTVINGEGTHGCLSVTAGNAWVDSLTFSNAFMESYIYGGLRFSSPGTLVANNCRFVRNTAPGNTSAGQAAHFSAGNVLLTNCVVAENNPIIYGIMGYGIYSAGASLTLVDCVVSNNSSDGFTSRQSYGCGLYFDNGTLDVLRTDFLSNSGGVNNAYGGGGAVYLGTSTNMAATFRNCVFRGNRALYYGDTGYGRGGAIWANLSGLGKTVTVVNCTFSDNRNETGTNATPGLGGAICLSAGTLVVRNSIFWTNSVKDGVSGSEIFATSAASKVVVSYSCFTGTNAPHVVAVNGASVERGPGLMADNPLYASATDVHLKSRGGRWNPALSAWVMDAETSPCIDAGDPADPAGPEPFPNKGRINMGAYGGTAQASLSWRPGTVILVY